MSTLIVALPVPPRLSSQGAAGVALAPTEYDYVFADDEAGAHLQSGRSPASLLPPAQHIVAVAPVQGVGWHRTTLPKAPPAKLRAALAGVLEDVLLEDDAELHLALAPHAKAGESVWIAAVNKAWLKAQLDTLDAAGHTVDRVTPAWVPDDAPAGHFFPGGPLPDGGDAGPQLAWRDTHGPLTLPATSDAARTLLTRLGADVPVRWTSEPECAADATRLAGGNVAALSASEFLFNATRSEWNLRQFDLTPQRRGSKAAKELLLQLWTAPVWRPARIGLAALLVLNLVGLNAWAWQQSQAVKRQRAAMVGLLQTTFPHVRAVGDAPAQMQKEVDLLRASAGKPGDADLEPLMYAAEAAWPPSRAAADGLTYEPGRLTVLSAGWSPQEVEAFRARLAPFGYDVESVPGRLTLSRSRAPVGADAPAVAPPVSATVRPAPAPSPGTPAATDAAGDEDEDDEATPPPPSAAVPATAPVQPAPQVMPAQRAPAPQPLRSVVPGQMPAPGAAPRVPAAQPESPHRMPGASPTGVNQNPEM